MKKFKKGMVIVYFGLTKNSDVILNKLKSKFVLASRFSIYMMPILSILHCIIILSKKTPTEYINRTNF